MQPQYLELLQFSQLQTQPVKQLVVQNSLVVLELIMIFMLVET